MKKYVSLAILLLASSSAWSMEIDNPSDFHPMDMLSDEIIVPILCELGKREIENFTGSLGALSLTCKRFNELLKNESHANQILLQSNVSLLWALFAQQDRAAEYKTRTGENGLPNPFMNMESILTVLKSDNPTTPHMYWNPKSTALLLIKKEHIAKHFPEITTIASNNETWKYLHDNHDKSQRPTMIDKRMLTALAHYAPAIQQANQDDVHHAAMILFTCNIKDEFKKITQDGTLFSAADAITVKLCPKSHYQVLLLELSPGINQLIQNRIYN